MLMQQLAGREIGARVALARREAGMTQEQLADLLNVSKRSVQDYEAGVTIPYKYFERLVGVFPSHSVAWFLHGTPEPDEGTDERLDAIEARLVRVEGLAQAVLDELQQLRAERTATPP